MKNQKGEASLPILLFLIGGVIILSIICSNEDSTREENFFTQCSLHGGHIAKEGVGFLSENPNKGQSRLKYLCVDDKGRIVE